MECAEDARPTNGMRTMGRIVVSRAASVERPSGKMCEAKKRRSGRRIRLTSHGAQIRPNVDLEIQA